MLLTEVARALEAQKVRFAVVGGYAVALYGAVRGTVDLDIVLARTEADYVGAECALRSIGLSSRLPVEAAEVFRFRREYIERRQLVAWSFVDSANPTRLVDIVITYERARLSTRTVRVGDQDVPLLSKAELIRMKEKSGRPQDLEDVRALRRLA